MVILQSFVPLKENKDFLRLYYRGKSSAKSTVVVYAARNRMGKIRVGITTSKKIGNATQRNRSRRVICAAWQSVLKENKINGGWDFVFVARNKTKYVKSTAVCAAMNAALTELGALK